MSRLHQAHYIAVRDLCFVSPWSLYEECMLLLTVGLLPVEHRADILVERAEHHAPQDSIDLPCALLPKHSGMFENNGEDFVCERIHVFRRTKPQACLFLQRGK